MRSLFPSVIPVFMTIFGLSLGVMTPDTAAAGVHIRLTPPKVVLVPKPKPRPPVVVTVRPPAPAPHHVWIDGRFDKRHGAWVWVPGHWVEPVPKPKPRVTVVHSSPVRTHRVTVRR